LFFDRVLARYTPTSRLLTLKQIAELKEHLNDISREAELLPEPTGPILLFGRQRHATQSELLAAVPLRSEADPLVETYFSIMQIHAGKKLLELKVPRGEPRLSAFLSSTDPIRSMKSSGRTPMKRQ
jgi:hypothetical protein